MSRGARWTCAVLLVLWCAASWKLSSERDPKSYVGVELDLPDKLVHGIEYAVGGILATGALWPGRRMPAWAAAVAFCTLWGVIDEIHQSFVPQRDSSVLDVAADVAGAAIGATLLSAVLARRQTSRRGVDDVSGPMKEPT